MGEPMLFEEYLQDIPLLHIWQGGKIVTAGGFTPADLQTLYNFLRERLPPHPVLLETGAGNTTITMLFLRPARLISIATEASLFERIREFCRKNDISDAALEVHIDGSQ